MSTTLVTNLKIRCHWKSIQKQKNGNELSSLTNVGFIFQLRHYWLCLFFVTMLHNYLLLIFCILITVKYGAPFVADMTELVTYGASSNKDRSRPYLVFADLRHFTALPKLLFLCNLGLFVLTDKLLKQCSQLSDREPASRLANRRPSNSVSHQVTGCQSLCELWPWSKDE